MRLVTEAQARACVTLEKAIEAVEESFRDLAEGRARMLPVVREALGNGKGTFGVKSGELDRYATVGLKAGGYWPGNAVGGALTNHQSTTLLFDAGTGQALAAIEANWLTEARTAAVGAIAIRVLSRPESRTIGIIGTGMQARSQLEAALLMREIETVRVCGREERRMLALCAALRQAHPGIEVLAAGREDTVRSSDILITVTPSREELFPADWSPEGQHINAMGADTVGKQELSTRLLRNASLFYDDLQQSLTLGEFQRLDRSEVGDGSLGDALCGKAILGQDESSRTVFDSTGIAVQDLAIGLVAMRATTAL